MPTLSESKSQSRSNTITSAGRNSTIGSEYENELSDSGGANENIVTFECKTKRKKFNATPGWHEITFSMRFALAVSAEDAMDDAMTYRGGGSEKRTSTFDIPKVNFYYHLEFKLTPNDPDTMKTDVVFFSNGAKVYPEGNDPKPVKTWSYDNQTWAAWVQNFKVKVNTEILVDLSNYQMEIKIWDSKEKCGPKARFDRPKVFKFPQPDIDQDPESIGGVKMEVLKLSRELKNTPTAKLYLNRPLPTLARKPILLEERPLTQTSKKLKSELPTAQTPAPIEVPPENYAIYAVTRPDQHSTHLPFSRLNDLAAPATPEIYSEIPMKSTQKMPIRKPVIQEDVVPPMKEFGLNKLGLHRDLDSRSQYSRMSGGNVSKAETVRTRRGRKEVDPLQEYYDKNGRANFAINMAHLFTKSTVIERLDDPVYPLEDVLVSINISESLLSDIQRVDLNPLVIRVKSAKSMPSTPLDYSQLQTQCEPTYCQYKFFNAPLRRTTIRPHGSEIVWDDVQVILTGLINSEEFKEYLSSSTMQIEVHDRDRKPPSDSLPPALFGSDLEDEKISNIGVVTSKRTQHCAFNNDQRPWDPYGIAKVEFCELLRGTKILNLCVPLTTCPIPNVLGTEKDENEKIYGVSGAVDGPKFSPLQAGDYISAGSVLNVTIELATNSFMKIKSETVRQAQTVATNNCPFGKIIFIFSDRNDSLLTSLRKLIQQINGAALGLKDSPDHVISNALKTHKWSAADKCNPHFNVVTGFHVFDSQWHTAVLEGLKDGGIQTLWQCLGKDIARNEEVKVLYNDSYSFSKRLYAPLDLDIGLIKTQQPLGEIVKQSLLYVRDMVPALCFQGIMKLSELIHCSSFQAAVINQLLPTSEMIQSFSREFGVPICMEDVDKPGFNENMGESDQSLKFFKPNDSSSRWTKKIDNYNDEFCGILNARGNATVSPNFIQRNVRVISEASACIKEYRAQSCPAKRKAEGIETAYNYSTQRLNSAVKAFDELKEDLDPNKRYSYSPHYLHSASVEPKKLPTVEFKETVNARNYTLRKGWVFPGVKSLILCNIHSGVPGVPYKIASQEPWIENDLHAAVLKPTIEGRENYPVEEYEKDFDRYKPPPMKFGNEPETIMSAGDKKQVEEAEVATKEHDIWLKRIVVNDTRFHTHRVLPNTEMQTSGLKSFNQIDRLKGLRKNPPQKYGLVNPGYQDLPALSTLKIGMPRPSEFAFTVKDDSENEAVARDLRKYFVPKKEQNRGFNPIFRGRDSLYLRKIQPLSVNDKNNNLYYEPLNECFRV